MASSRLDKPAHMLVLGPDFTPLLMSTPFHKCKERLRDAVPERYGVVTNQLQLNVGKFRGCNTQKCRAYIDFESNQPIPRAIHADMAVLMVSVHMSAAG